MRLVFIGAVALALSACNQTAQTSAPVVGAVPTAHTALQELPPIYEPLIDRHRVNEAKYQQDLAVCRKQAAPQEQVARAAAKQAQTGAALSMVGSVLDVVPVGSFKQAQTLGATSAVLQTVGNANAAQGAVTSDAATNDYALVVNTCIRHRGYVLLR